jgi:hypothetical protein
VLRVGTSHDHFDSDVDILIQVLLVEALPQIECTMIALCPLAANVESVTRQAGREREARQQTNQNEPISGHSLASYVRHRVLRLVSEQHALPAAAALIGAASYRAVSAAKGGVHVMPS